MRWRPILGRSLFCVICLTGPTGLHLSVSLGFPVPTLVAADGTTTASQLYDARQILDLVTSLVPTIDNSELRDASLKTLAQIQRTAGDLTGSRSTALLIADAHVKAD